MESCVSVSPATMWCYEMAGVADLCRLLALKVLQMQCLGSIGLGHLAGASRGRQSHLSEIAGRRLW